MSSEQLQIPDPTRAEETFSATPSRLRAWLALVWHCLQRQARARQMVWIALALLGFTAALIAINAAMGRLGMGNRRYVMQPSRSALAAYQGEAIADSRTGFGAARPATNMPRVVLTYEQGQQALELTPSIANFALPQIATGPLPGVAVLNAVSASSRVVLDHSGFTVFATWVVFSIFCGFLLPLWSLAFATEALGGEREGRTLVWLLSRPLPRWSIYLAKFLALLPWSVGLNLGGFALVCYLAGWPGRLSFSLFWPAVLGATLAYCALYHLMGACFRRAAVVALVYTFFLETILGSMPGYLKRVSLSFYTRCLMFDSAQDYNISPEKPSVYLPVDGTTAWYALAGVTVVLLLVGMAVFSRSEYQDLT